MHRRERDELTKQSSAKMTLDLAPVTLPLPLSSTVGIACATTVVGATGFRTMVPAASMSGVTFAYKGAVRRAFVGLSWVYIRDVKIDESEYLGAGNMILFFCDDLRL